MKTKIVRPVLVESKERTNIWAYKGRTLRYNEANFNDPDETKYYQLILISLEDEKIEVGDKFHYEESKTIEISFGMLNGLVLIKENSNIGCNLSFCKKVIATQSQLSPEYIQQFIEEYNKGEEKDVEIEMEECTAYEVGLFSDIKYKPKLTNGYVTIVTKEVPTYTEDEMYRTLHNLMTDIKLKGVAINDDIDLKEWFNRHKKK